MSDADIDALITQMPQFQVDGQFNRDRFVGTVRNIGMGVGEFRENMRKNYVINQIRASISQSGVVAGENAAQLLRIQNQTRDFRVLTVNPESLADQVVVTDDDIQAFYDENAADFREPEQVDAAYLTLSLGALASAIEISDEDLRAYYDERAEEFAREERRAAHILIEPGDEAEATLRRFRNALTLVNRLLTWPGSIRLIRSLPVTAAILVSPDEVSMRAHLKRLCLPWKKG